LPIHIGALFFGEEFLDPQSGGALKGTSVSSVQMPCRLGSPQGVLSAEAEATGACAAAGVMDAEMTTLKAVPAMATVIIKNLSRMVASL